MPGLMLMDFELTSTNTHQRTRRKNNSKAFDELNEQTQLSIGNRMRFHSTLHWHQQLDDSVENSEI
jgi:hypothetical protein